MGTVFNYATAESVEVWLKDWEDDITKNPADIVLGRTLHNVLELVLAELQSLSPQKRAKGRIERSESGQAQWAREMLELLEQEFVNDAQGRIARFRKYCSAEFDALEQEVRRGHFDIGGIEAAIEALLAIDWNELLFNELRLELARGKRYDRPALRLISNVVFELAIKNYTPKRLKSIPRDVFTREFTRHLLAARGEAVVTSESVAQGLHATVDWVSTQTTEALRVGTAWSEAGSLFELSKSVFWEFSVYELLRLIQVQVAEMLVNRNSSADATMEGEAAIKWDPVPGGLALFVAERYAQALYTFTLRTEIESQLESSGATPLASFVHSLVEAVLQECGFGDIRAEAGDGDLIYGAPRRALEKSLVTPLARMLSQTLLQIDWEDEPWAKESIDQIRHWLSSELQVVCGQFAPVNLPLTHGSALSLSQELVCRMTFREKLWSHLKPLTALLVHRPNFVETVQLRVSEIARAETLQRLWNQWQDVAARYAETFHLFYFLPWKDLTVSCLHQLIDALSQEINRSPGERFVFYKVQGLDCAGTKWQLGNVLFYDPRVYDFGANRTFYPEAQSLESLAGVRVDVKGESQLAARAKAHAWVEEALDVLSFALSVGRDLGGINPRILPQVFEITKASPGYWTGEASTPASAMPTAARTIKQKDRHILELYDSLLLHSATGAPPLSEIEKVFLKSVRWYRMGRWQDDPVESFLFHWIALESIFVKGERAVERLLLENVPKLETTALGLLGKYWLWWAEEWEAVIQGIRGCPALLVSVEKDSSLDGWDHYYHVLLDAGNVIRLEQYAKAEASMSTKVVRDWVSKVKDLDSSVIKVEVERRRAANRYRLHVMYVRRNMVVHEAHSFRDVSDMAIYAEELKGLLEKVLRFIAIEARNPRSQCQTLEDLIELASRPW